MRDPKKEIVLKWIPHDHGPESTPFCLDYKKQRNQYAVIIQYRDGVYFKVWAEDSIVDIDTADPEEAQRMALGIAVKEGLWWEGLEKSSPVIPVYINPRFR